jgi:hypothetical protein
MLKQSVSRIKKILPVLLAVLFVMSLTVVSASAYRGYGYNHWCGYGGAYAYPYGILPSVASFGVGLASPVVATAAVPAVTTEAVPAVTTSTVAASPLVVASGPGILTSPLGFGYGAGYGLYPGLGYGGFGPGWGYGGFRGCHRR